MFIKSGHVAHIHDLISRSLGIARFLKSTTGLRKCKFKSNGFSVLGYHFEIGVFAFLHRPHISFCLLIATQISVYIPKVYNIYEGPNITMTWLWFTKC